MPFAEHRYEHRVKGAAYAAEALAYNGLVQSWPEISRLAREGGKPRTDQPALFEEDEE